MIESRRHVLNRIMVSGVSHPGLWLDRYVRNQLEHNESPGKDAQGRPLPTPNQALVDQVDQIPISSFYNVFYARWEKALKEHPDTSTRTATAKGRMVVGLGDESVIETAITLHHTYGTPIIPGSALKGLAAHYARNYLDQAQWGVKSQAYRTLFGDIESAGYITFFDALYIPNTGHAHKPLHADVITVHHPKYYQGQTDDQGNASPPADWDSPTIIPFLSATGSYLVALAGSEAWVHVTFTILEWALAKLGIGAKTSSGYGRMELKPPPFDPEQAEANRFIEQVKQIRERDVAGQIPNYADRWRNLDVSATLKRQVAQAIIAKVRNAGRERAVLETLWYKELLASLQ